MPFYEYECGACKHHTEVLQKISDAPLKKCPECGKQQLKRLISAPVFRLKGGGWYETDFKSDNETKRNIAGREEGESKAEGSKPGESKPDTAAKDTAAATEKKTEPKLVETKSAETKSAETKRMTGKTGSATKRPTAKPVAKQSKPAAKKKAGRR
jgi:putative FmdB family regulatory protein